MDHKLKYLRYETLEKEDTCVVFPDSIAHDEMFKKLGIHLGQVIGAGFCYFDKCAPVDLPSGITRHVHCVAYGESYSLGVGSNDTDGAVLTKVYCG